MGCTNSASQDVQKPQKRVEKIEDLKVNHSEMVSEKQGKINTDYNLLNPALGKGAFGEVRKAVHKITQQTRAVKMISKTATSLEDQEKLKDEVNILKTLDHPNIIKVYEFYQDARNFYIVTELCTGGELFDKILQEKSFSERRAAETMKQVLGAVLYCHENNIVHRDLKPENILYESTKPGSVLKVCDFGTSRMFDPNQKMSQKIGTPYYIAPEVLENKYDEKCDIWSCGVIMFILLCGSPPFNGESDNEILRQVKRGVYKFEDEEWNNVSKEAKLLISKMLQKDPHQRISAREALNDPWIQIYCQKPEVDLPQLAKSLTNMKSFQVTKKFQEAALVFMVNFLASKEEKNELLQQFQSLDLNNDGKLSRQELIIGYQKVLNAADAEEEVDRIMNAVDKNQSGAIDYSEFVLATINREKLMEKERLEMAFRMFDRDGSGTISTEEIKQLFGANTKIAESVFQELIKEVDSNSDGQISFQEFREMMLSKVASG